MLKETTKQNIEQTSSKAAWKLILRSPVFLGLCLFVFFNILFLSFKPLSKVDPESLPSAHTWVWWAAQEYLNQKKSPDVVLIGSSLVMHPVSRLDANFLNKDFDYVHHHTSQYLDEALKNSLGLKNASCFNFALPGCMASDDYIIVRTMFNNVRKPKILVVGLSLRDFIDAGVTCPASTPAFRYLKRFVPIDNILSLAMPQIWQRLDYYIGKAIYLWDKKLDAQVLLSEDLKKNFWPLLQPICNSSLIAKVDPDKNMPSNLRSEIEENMFIVKSHQPYSWEDNSAEYIKRYRKNDAQMFSIQCQFLSILLGYCKKEQIQVVLVNMPLTQENYKLMPAGSYDKYLSVLKNAALANHSTLLDLNANHDFNKADFYDTSHMNATGGKKLIDNIAAVITNDKILADSLNTKEQLAGTANNSL